MTTLVVTYVVAWVGIGAYGVRLILRERLLIRRLDSLNPSIESDPHHQTRVKRAA
jgi:hypothetical protein